MHICPVCGIYSGIYAPRIIWTSEHNAHRNPQWKSHKWLFLAPAICPCWDKIMVIARSPGGRQEIPPITSPHIPPFHLFIFFKWKQHLLNEHLSLSEKVPPQTHMIGWAGSWQTAKPLARSCVVRKNNLEKWKWLSWRQTEWQSSCQGGAPRSVAQRGDHGNRKRPGVAVYTIIPAITFTYMHMCR